MLHLSHLARVFEVTPAVAPAVAVAAATDVG